MAKATKANETVPETDGIATVNGADTTQASVIDESGTAVAVDTSQGLPRLLTAHDPATGEVVPVKEGMGAVIAGMKFKVAKIVNRPVLSLVGLEQFAIKIASKMYKGKQVTVKRKDGGSFSSEADMIDIIELVSNRPMVMVLGTVMKGTLVENYPNDSYVGKFFVGEREPNQGKAYTKYALTEIEPDNG